MIGVLDRKACACGAGTTRLVGIPKARARVVCTMISIRILFERFKHFNDQLPPCQWNFCLDGRLFLQTVCCFPNKRQQSRGRENGGKTVPLMRSINMLQRLRFEIARRTRTLARSSSDDVVYKSYSRTFHAGGVSYSYSTPSPYRHPRHTPHIPPPKKPPSVSSFSAHNFPDFLPLVFHRSLFPLSAHAPQPSPSVRSLSFSRPCPLRLNSVLL